MSSVLTNSDLSNPEYALPTPIKIKDGIVPNFTNWYFNNDPFDITNVTNGLNVSIGTPVQINATILDNQGILNASLYYWTSITDNAGPDRVDMINYRLANGSVTDNMTITGIQLNGTDFINNASVTNASDDLYHEFSNGSSGILMAYGVNLTQYLDGDNYAAEDYVKLTVEGHVNTTQNVTTAGIWLYNWTATSLTEISNSSLNITSDLTTEIIITGANVSDFINNLNNGRIEMFVNVTADIPVQLLIDYIYIEIHKDPTDDYSATIPGLPWERAGDHKGGRKNITFWAKAYDLDGSYNTSNSTNHLVFNYTNIDVEAPEYSVSLQDGDHVSGFVPIQITGLDLGSGLEIITLEIDEGTSYEENKTWTVADFELIDPTYQNITVTYDWNVTGFLNYNGSAGTNATHFLNISFLDRDGYENCFNSTGNFTVYVDSSPPETPYLNVRTSDLYNLTLNDLSEFTLTNQTVANLTLNGTQFVNTTAAVLKNDNFFHGCSNDSTGILVPYALELADYNLTMLENLNYLNLTVTAKVNVTGAPVTWAGLQLYNWTGEELYDVDSSGFESTSKVNITFQVNRNTMWDFINSTGDINHLEILVNITATVPISLEVYYVEIFMERFRTHEIYCDNIINTNLTIAVKGYDDIFYDKLILSIDSTLNFTWTTANSTNGTFAFKYMNSSDLPSGDLTMILTVYDKAGNTNSTTILVKNDNEGPFLNFTSHFNNSLINKDGTWNAIEHLVINAQDEMSDISYVILYLDGELGPVYSGQQGQIVEYNATGHVVYIQINTTWRGKDFDDYIHYYWNVSNLSTGSLHNLTIIGEDILGNINQTTIWVNISNYVSNLSIHLCGLQDQYYNDKPFEISFNVTNTGNTTLQNLVITPIVPSGFVIYVQNYNDYLITSLAPNQSVIVVLYLVPTNPFLIDTVQIGFSITCNVTEQLLFGITYSTQYSTAISVTVNPLNSAILNSLLVMLVVFGGILAALLLHFLVRKVRQRSIMVTLEDLKKPKKKKR